MLRYGTFRRIGIQLCDPHPGLWTHKSSHSIVTWTIIKRPDPLLALRFVHFRKKSLLCFVYVCDCRFGRCSKRRDEEHQTKLTSTFSPPFKMAYPTAMRN